MFITIIVIIACLLAFALVSLRVLEPLRPARPAARASPAAGEDGAVRRVETKEDMTKISQMLCSRRIRPSHSSPRTS
jgi:hypothetical protein